MRITDTVRYVGVNDRKLDLFEGHYIVPNGMAYNSYLILGDKVAVTDTVGEGFGEEWPFVKHPEIRRDLSRS